MSNVYYVDFPYMTAAVKWIGLALVSLAVALYGVWRRSFYGLLFATSFALCFLTLITIPDGRTGIMSSMVEDEVYLSDTSAMLRLWFEDHDRFPSNEFEFEQAIIGKAAAKGNPVLSARTSPYKQHGNSLPYVYVLHTNASSPDIGNVSHRPGVIYYSVSSDWQEFWLTMTGLNSEVARSAEIKRMANRTDKEFIVLHGKDDDQLVNQQRK
jgi:hypothetical protein